MSAFMDTKRPGSIISTAITIQQWAIVSTIKIEIIKLHTKLKTSLILDLQKFHIQRKTASLCNKTHSITHFPPFLQWSMVKGQNITIYCTIYCITYTASIVSLSYSVKKKTYGINSICKLLLNTFMFVSCSSYLCRGWKQDCTVT